MSVRKKLHGTAARPRLTVYRSNRYINLQLIDDDKGVTLLSESDRDIKKTAKVAKTQRASQIAKNLADKMKKLKLEKVVFDRGGYRYHGRVKAVAQTLREEGIEL